MIYAFMDGGGLAVHSSIDEVRREHEAIDVENEDVVFFDEYGRRLLPYFTRPNRKTHLFGKLSWVEHGEFELEPATDQSTDQMLVRLAEASYLERNEFYSSLDEIRAHFQGRGSAP